MNRLASLLVGIGSLLCPGCQRLSAPRTSSDSPGSSADADSLAAHSDWVIDRCRITFRGRAVPVGSPYQELVAFFGNPSDSSIGDSSASGRGRTYYWDGMGLEASAWVERGPARYQLQVGYLQRDEPTTHGSSEARFARGTSTIGIRPYGRLDSSNHRRIIEAAFHSSGILAEGKSYFLQVPFTADTYLDIEPRYGHSMASDFQALNFFLAAPPEGTYQSYPQLYPMLDANCKVAPSH